MHCMLMDLLHRFEVLSTTEETLFNFLLCHNRLICNFVVMAFILAISCHDIPTVIR